jgi:mono/diheme cytochrome c family protein
VELNTAARMRSPFRPLVAAIGFGVFVSLSGCSAPASDEGMEMAVVDPQANASVERGRLGVLTHACGDCHGGFDNPDAPGWMAGVMIPVQEFAIPMDPTNPRFSYPLMPGPGYFITRPRNITPDMETGIGRFTERQIFNALRYGLRPEETPEVVITSTVPGEGNFPAVPRYLAPPMPWPTFRHMTDQELWDIAAYLKRGVRPVRNEVAESEGPPDFWAGFYADPMAGYGTFPARPFPASQEQAQP